MDHGVTRNQCGLIEFKALENYNKLENLWMSHHSMQDVVLHVTDSWRRAIDGEYQLIGSQDRCSLVSI